MKRIGRQEGGPPRVAIRRCLCQGVEKPTPRLKNAVLLSNIDAYRDGVEKTKFIDRSEFQTLCTEEKEVSCSRAQAESREGFLLEAEFSGLRRSQRRRPIRRHEKPSFARRNVELQRGKASSSVGRQNQVFRWRSGANHSWCWGD